MKNRGLIIALFSIFLGVTFGCNAQADMEAGKKQETAYEKVEVYYFHYERRCATCMAVENESEKALVELYPEKVESGEITFLSINLEDESNEALAEKYEVSGQSLLLVKGEKQDNLTNTAFLYARTSPDKLKEAIKESIDKL